MRINPARRDIWVSEIGSWKCPNCGGTDFTEMVPSKYCYTWALGMNARVDSRSRSIARSTSA
jgi:hypothetical protein